MRCEGFVHLTFIFQLTVVILDSRARRIATIIGMTGKCEFTWVEFLGSEHLENKSKRTFDPILTSNGRFICGDKSGADKAVQEEITKIKYEKMLKP